MGTHWTDKRASKTAIGHALRDRGWTLFGYTKDASDSMTDYWAPAHWDGVATKDGAVAVVDLELKSKYDADKPGKVEMESVRIVEGFCDICHGGKADPALTGWTLRKAQADPRAFHAAEAIARQARGDRSLNLMPDVVSPIPFLDDGRPNCPACGGSGEKVRYETRPNGVTWPTFQGNPPHRNWHVEREGRILDSGTGAHSFGRDPYGNEAKERERARLDEFIGRIDRASRHDFDASANNLPVRDAGTGEHLIGGVTVRNGKRAGYVELEYPSKPSKEHRDLLKARGFRWAPSSQCWYGLAARLPANLALPSSKPSSDPVFDLDAELERMADIDANAERGAR